MSQLHPAGHDDQGELDPLLEFNSEPPAVESSAKPINLASPPASPAGEDVAPLQQRLEQAERSLDRARIEISSLKSDLATLVGTIEDIKKRLSRRPEILVSPTVARVPPHRIGFGRPAAMLILLLTIGAAIWGAVSVAIIEIPEAPPIETESSTPLPAAPQPSEAPTPSAEVQAAPSSAPARPVRQIVDREPAAPATYVGTLAIDSKPAGEVFINRQIAGRTPMRAENLRAGSHLIWIEREGYHRWTRVVAVAANRVTSVWADLNPLAP